MLRHCRSLLIRLFNVVRPSRNERELAEEIQSVIDLHIEANTRSGMSFEEARRAALVKFGGLDAAKEAWRERRRLPFLEVMMRDARYAFRLIQKNPVLALAVIFVLAVGIGGSIAIFSIVNAVLLKPLPYPAADRLMLLWGNVQRAALERRGASLPDYLDWSAATKSFDGLAAYWSGSFTMTGIEDRQIVNAEIVGSQYFHILGIKPTIGREFTSDEEVRPGSTPVVILGNGFWRDHFGGDPSVLGKQVELDSQNFTVVGVMPPGFLGLTDQAALFVPPAVLPGAKDMLANRGSRWFVAVGRLSEGVTPDQAQAEMNNISLNLANAHPNTNDKRGVEVAPLIEETFGSVRPALLALLGAVGMVLLIACSNVANLLLVRTDGRQSEIAVRTALGAGRREILQLLLTESLVMSAFGAAAGLWISGWVVKLILTASPIQLPTFVSATMDSRVVLFAGVVAILVGVFIGLVPALHAESSNLVETLKSNSSKTTGSAARRRIRSILVVAEVALTVVLLICAGLFVESFRKLTQVDAGFRTDHLLTVQLNAAPEARLNPQALRDGIAGISGVDSVTVASDIPFASSSAVFYTAEGQPVADATTIPRAYAHRVSPGYFKTMGIGVVAGREFEALEPNTSVIVSEAVIKRFWPGQDAIGKRLKTGRVDSTAPWLNIVGVVRETKTRNLPNNPTADPDLFFPYVSPPTAAGILVRTSGEPAELSAQVRNEIKRVDKLAVISNVSTMDELISPLTARSRFTSWLTGVFSIIALLLALVGIYGTMSYTVGQRTREIGVRIALGANAPQIFGMVVGRALALVGVGLIAGVIGAVAASHGIRDLLFGVSPIEPSVFVGVAMLVMTTGALAAFLPARRAVRIDPMRALRDE